MKIGIIGHGADKFTRKGKTAALYLIQEILYKRVALVLISGHSPVGGIDIWAEDMARLMEISLDLKIPRQHTWNSEYGYKQRNLDIAKESDELHVILVKNYPPEYKGMKFVRNNLPYCYHCDTDDHVKSGACWTAKQCKKFGKPVYYHFIEN